MSMENNYRVKWVERPKFRFLDFGNKSLENHMKKTKSRDGYVICSHRGLSGKCYVVVKTGGKFKEVPLSWLKPFYTTYELQEEKIIT